MVDLKWYVILSDLSVVREQETEDGSNFWFTLKNQLRDTKLQVKEWVLVFRTHMESVSVPEGSLGVYFSKSISKDLFSLDAYESYVFGYIDKDKFIHKHFYKIPELTLDRVEKEMVNLQDKRIILYE